ncbi:hypothetical protein [Salibacterium aidingense]|uniref:hypothetical protein n=1 Tax=Salibacterium aidingense TaxID=384933 RepID=UPI0004062350|nr:hypothetical protein [Salibacterium aidingense]
MIDVKDEISSFTFDIIHLPDKKFVDWCTENYTINRGVFNVIDNWFFDHGLKDIIQRRTAIIQYLKFLQNWSDPDSNKLFVSFGKGGVKRSLCYFVDECQHNHNSQK